MHVFAHMYIKCCLRMYIKVLDAMGRAGFEIGDYKDVAKDGDLPWSVKV